MNKDSEKTVLMTGATSGIGYQALKEMIKDGYEVIVTCTNDKSIKSLYSNLAKEKFLKTSYYSSVDAQVCDLSSLKEVKSFTNYIKRNYNHIDLLILNAGMQYTGSKTPRYSVDNFELTFSVNHLSQFYLTYNLIKLLLKSTRSRVLITSSEVHNPNTSGGRIGSPAGLANLSGMNAKSFDMIDGESEFNADKAYKDSKLCNVLFARELSKRINQKENISDVIAWAPGLVIPKTNEGFFRYSREYNEIGQRLFSLLARDLFRITESVEDAGRLLFDLSTSRKFRSNEFKYYSNNLIGIGQHKLIESEISNEASNDKIAQLLWEKSLKLLDIKDYSNW